MDNLNIMRQVLGLEAEAILTARDRLDGETVEELSSLFRMLGKVSGNLVFCGVGKSGIIAKKLASTFSSLGLPSLFLHPVEALHGDLGRLRNNDCIVFISKSGTTGEIIKLMPYLSVPKEQKIALVGNLKSPIAAECGILLDCSVEKEACINNQAPTTSSTVALALGDAMAVLYESIVGLNKEGFAVNHPGGILGKSMLMKVSNLMWEKDDCATLAETNTLKDAVLEMTSYNVGGCAVIDDSGILKGIIVEGDIRRVLTNEDADMDITLDKIMNPSPIFVDPNDLAYDALMLMEQRESQIDILPVIEENGIFTGFLRLHDLIREGFSIRN